MAVEFLIKAHKFFTALLLLITVSSVISCSDTTQIRDGEPAASKTANQTIPVYGYKILNKYPHDTGAFTQGLVFDRGELFEGTGLYGKSSLRRIDLETGKVIKTQEISAAYFGEGITVFGDTIVQLTWQSNIGFVYDKNTFKMLRSFAYTTEGWGITHDGKNLIYSDGTATLYFINPETLTVVSRITVHDNNKPVTRLNELEYIDGQIYANVWQTDRIAIINPGDGKVTAWIDLSGLLQSQSYNQPADVLNGIAYEREKRRLFVTGKLWPWLFEIEIVRK